MAANFDHLKKDIQVGDATYSYYSLEALNDERVNKLPHSIRVLLESAVRNCDGLKVTETDVNAILDWENTSKTGADVQFKPSRVLMQDFTGVPAVVDLAAMRDAVKRMGGDEAKVTPQCPVDLVIDHSVQVDFSGDADALEKNEEREFERNRERFEFLKWGSTAFDGLRIVPPGSGIVHQVNLEYLGRSVFNKDGVLYFDSLVGTDSHTTMINGLGIVGWGVGGIEAEAVMVGMPVGMTLPQVVGYKLTGTLSELATATDLVLTIVQNLRKLGVVGKFVEFYGPGVAQLSLADRATIANMAPEYGATMGFFPPDATTIDYLRKTGRAEDHLAYTEAFLSAQGMLRDYTAGDDPSFSATIELDLSTVEPCISGPKRPHDRVTVANNKADFAKCLASEVGFKGFNIPEADRAKSMPITVKGENIDLKHGSIVIAAITSCTNTSNPSVMLQAGLLAKAAVAKGLKISAAVKTSLAPGSNVVKTYLEEADLQKDLDTLGFNIVGYGCTTCIGNSGPLPEEIVQATNDGNLVTCGVLSGNRNFEGRISPHVRANYLASPPLVVAYALAGRVDIDFETEPLGQDASGQDVFLKELWPSNQAVAEVESAVIRPKMFQTVYESIAKGTPRWNALETPTTSLYPWDDKSTYIHDPPFFKTMDAATAPAEKIENAFVLCNFGDFITTDHISPAGTIARRSPAARYLESKGVNPKDFNTYGARRGNDEVMARGTFANIRIVNKFMGGPAAPQTVHIPSGDEMDIFDCAKRYEKDGEQVIILAGADYGSGSSRDWAAKGPYLQGVKAVCAVTYERIHRSNLVYMGIAPLQFKDGANADSLGLTGKETFSIDLTGEITPRQDIEVVASNGTTFTATLRFDTALDVECFKHGGILKYALRQML